MPTDFILLNEGESSHEEAKLPIEALPPLELPALNFSLSDKEKDAFADKQHKAWDKSHEARCDFQFNLRLTRRSDVNFTSIWQKSILGRTLTEIKADDAMIPFFANEIVPTIKDTIGHNLSSGNWCICTSPKRRHTTRNFATLISMQIADLLNIPFYEDVAFCRSKHRVGAKFDLNILPKEPNVIVYDDFVTTGQTLRAMKDLLLEHNKNLAFFTGVNNKL